MRKNIDFYLSPILIVCILGLVFYVLVVCEKDNKLNLIPLSIGESSENTRSVKLTPEINKSKFDEVPDYKRKDMIEKLIGADVLSYSIFLVLVVSNMLLHYKNKNYGYLLLLIFSVFQSIAMSVLINIFLFTEFLIDWSLWFCFEYLLLGLIFGFLTFLVGISISKIFMISKITICRYRTSFSFNKYN
jgi:hypothetical protein